MKGSSAGPEESLRRLVIGDERFIQDVLVRRGPGSVPGELGSTTQELVRLGAVVLLDSGTALVDSQVAAGLASGGSRADVVGVLQAVAPCIGSVRLVGVAPRVAAAIGYDVDAQLEHLEW